MLLTEAGSKRRAALFVIQGEDALKALDPGGLELLDGDFRAVSIASSARENHTLKRALTDPHLFSGVGNAYSDEILHRAWLSPLALTQKLEAGQAERLFAAMRKSSLEWTDACEPRRATAFPRR